MNNLKNAQKEMKGIQADVFSVLKSLIEYYSVDERLRKLIKQPYYNRNFDKYVIGVNGNKCYGVIENVDLKKRDAIVREVINFLLDEPIQDTEQKWCEFSIVASTYFQIDDWLERVTLIPVMKGHMRKARLILISARKKMSYLKFSMN